MEHGPPKGAVLTQTALPSLLPAVHRASLVAKSESHPNSFPGLADLLRTIGELGLTLSAAGLCCEVICVTQIMSEFYFSLKQRSFLACK